MDKRKRGRPAKTAPPASTAPARSRRTRGETEELVDAGPATQPEPTTRIPRRGAPTGRVASPSINGREREDEEEEEGEDGIDDAQEENATDDAAERELMLLTLPDLAYGAKQLLKVLAVDTSKLTGVQKKLLQMKRKAFLSTREVYATPTMPQFFLDWSWFEQVHGESSVEPESSTALVLGNLAILLNTIYGIENGEDVDVRAWLDELDVSVPFLFREEGSRDGDVDVALSIRTALTISKLADAKGKTKQTPQETIVSVFCESDAPGTAPARIVNGPFRELAGENSDATAKASSDRAEALYRLAKDKKSAVQSLNAAFPVEDLLDLLKTWAAEAFEDAEAPKPAATTADEPTEEEVPETQPIQRPGVGQSLFSLKGLSNMLNLGNSSRRHTVGPAQEASQHTPATSTSPGARKRGFSEIGADFASDDDDGEFETDRRPVDEARRDAMRLAQPSPARRPRLESEHARSPATPAGRHFNAADVDPAVSPEMAQMRREKQLVMQDARAAASLGEVRQPDTAALEQQRMQVKRRVAWSDSDTLLLVDLIDSHNAVWADIARIGNHQDQSRYFIPVRNQQACRDRARNYKVDLLLTSKLLPRNFDQVALSKKEIERVVRHHRNPFRREQDVDEDNQPTNTAYVP